MSPQANYYEALGLTPAATTEQIKKKYRELARLYHPDVNASPEAAHRILLVNQAYRVLGDPDRRAAYDAERVLRTPSPPRRPANPPSSPPRSRQAPTPPPGAPRSRVYYDGFGRAYTPPKTERRAGPTGAGPQQWPMPDSNKASIEQFLNEAKLAFINRQLPLAQRLCQDALRLNPKEAIAHEILGDVYLRQGDPHRASTAFAYAIQFNPRNQSAQSKLDRLMRAVNVPPLGGPSITYTQKTFRVAGEAAPASEASLAIVALAAGGALVAAPVLLSLYPGPSGPDTFGLSLNLLAALGVAGVAGGLLLALYGRMRPFAEEVSAIARGNGRRSRIPLGIVLGLFSVLWFYGSLLVYIGIAATRNGFSPSILRAYAVTLGMICVFSLAYHPGAAFAYAAPLWAGNALFPAALLGWNLGDALRLRGRL